MAPVLREHIRLGSNTASVDVAVEHDHPSRYAQQRVGLELLFGNPRIGIGGRLDGNHESPDVLCRRVQHVSDTLLCLLSNEVLRLEEHAAQGQYEHGCGYQHHADGKLR